MIDYLRMKWGGFKYNFSWPDYVFLFEGWLAKSSMAVPFVGYLILFNDAVVQHLTFSKLTGEATVALGLSSGARLKFIYCGLISLGWASIIYYLRRPYAMRIGRDQFEYVERALVHFTISDYIRINGEIKHSDFDPFTQHGKYNSSEFVGFLRASSGDEDRSEYNWVNAKNQYEGLLRSMLIESYFRQKITRRRWLVVAISISLLGYVLLLIPSVDLFLQVMQVIVGSIVR